MNSNKFKVRLKSVITGRSVVFEASPDINVTRATSYKNHDPIHMPGQIFSYGFSASRIFQLNNVKLISRTPNEATKNMRKLQILRSWTMPYFGNEGGSTPELTFDNEIDFSYQADAAASSLLAENPNATEAEVIAAMDQYDNPNVVSLLGNPPDILYFSAYSDPNDCLSKLSNICEIPVVIQTINIVYPTDCDYIETNDSTKQPFPVLMTLDFQLNETHSPKEYADYSLTAFRNGELPHF